MSKLKGKVLVSRLQAPIKFGNIWEHSLNGQTSKDVIFLKIYAKQSKLYARGFGIIYILKYVVSKQVSKPLVSSIPTLNWVEETRDDFINRYEVIDFE